jgi:hypothetical protein
MGLPIPCHDKGTFRLSQTINLSCLPEFHKINRLKELSAKNNIQDVFDILKNTNVISY